MHKLALKGIYKSRRPTIRIEVDAEPLCDGCTICMSMDEAMGQPARYTEMTPDEARELANMLIECAVKAERNEPEPVEEEQEQDV